MENKDKKPIYIGIIIFILVIFLFSNTGKTETTKNKQSNKRLGSKTFRIISSQENKESEDIIYKYARSKGYNVIIDYAGTLDIISKLNNGESYDGIWISNSIWTYMLDSSVKVTNSKCTSINPVIFGIKKSKANELGWIDKTIYTRDIVQAIGEGKLKFSMSNPTSTNSGASAYLGMLSTLAGNPEVLTEENLKDENLQNNLKTLYTGMERSSGSEDFLEELFLNGNYEAVVAYESSIISINKQLTAEGKEPLYAIYPIDGVSISDSPFEYIDNKDQTKKEIFIDIQNYLLSNEGQSYLQLDGKRTWYGGISDAVDKTIFNPEWGIDTTKYISPIKYPSTKVIKQALNLYQTALRKPVHVAFCLDYSGSMVGEGYNELVSAMEYILTEKAEADFIQFNEKDKIDVIPFATQVYLPWSTSSGTNTKEILQKIKSTEPNGTTAIYPATQKALQLLQNENKDEYNLSVVLMTDGAGNVGTYSELNRVYNSLAQKIPVYSITFGEASESQLNKIANLTNGKVFDGKLDLVRAFKEVRGYN